MPIFDKALNPLQIGVDAEGKFVGQESGASAGFPLEIYKMIDESIRLLDAAEGQYLLRRLLAGPQAEWEETVAKIGEIHKIRSIADCPGPLLKFLKLTLGWTADTDHLTDPLDEATLRRLLSQTIPLWRIRGTEDAYLATLKLVFAAASRCWNWFDLRWVLDDTILTEQHQGRDPTIISLPGPPDMSEYTSNLRIVDDGTGTMDRDLAVNFVKLFRPLGERITITWISFLDLFDGDDRLWTVEGTGPLTVQAGRGELVTGPETAYAPAGEAFATAGHLGYCRLQGHDAGAPGAFGGVLWRQENGDAYRVLFDVPANSLHLAKVVGGIQTVLGTYSFATDSEEIHYDVWYGLRWEAADIGGTSEIRLYVDGSPRLTVVDATFNEGTFGFYHEADTFVYVDEFEVMPIPTDMTEIGVNP